MPGVVRMLTNMPEADEGLRQIRGLQPWGYSFFLAVIALFFILWFVRDRREPSGD